MPDSPYPVLVVDGDAGGRGRLIAALERAGMSTIEATNGTEALVVVQEHPVSVVVLDNEMPGMSGAEVVHALRDSETTRNLPVLIVTGMSSIDDLVRGLEGGADDYVTKPVGVDELVARVRAQQRRHEAWTDVVEPLRRRVSAAESLARLPAGAGIDDVAAAVCEALTAQTGGGPAGMYMFASERRAVVLAGPGPPGTPDVPLAEISDATSSYLYGRARHGAWTERASAVPFGSFVAARGDKSDHAFIIAPIVRDEVPIGILFMGGPPGVEPPTLGRRHLATLLDFAATSGMLLGAAFLRESREETVRADLRSRCDGRLYAVEFQPVVDLITGQTIGYEALTRWDDGTRPDVPFAQARRIDMSIELEIATMTAALEAAADLPGGVWLGVNLSPDTILGYPGLDELLANAGRPIVLELTEHERIDDYDTLRARLAELCPPTRIAVDDAGAGYATLQHVLALAPAYVKLDLSWVRGINDDQPRQAMVAGLVHFARETGRELIAEGVETTEELETMRNLGVDFGQGYFFARSAPAADFSRVAGLRTPAPT